MPRKPVPKPDDPEQSKRFIDTAEEVGADADDEALERAFKKIAPPKSAAPTQRHPSRQKSQSDSEVDRKNGKR
jgi:hypothetical protein